MTENKNEDQFATPIIGKTRNNYQRANSNKPMTKQDLDAI